MRAQPTASHYVNGRYIDDEQGAPLPVIYPATGETIAMLRSATPNVLELAIEAGARCAAGLGATEAGRARPHPAPRRRHIARAQRRSGAHRDAGYRQGDPGDAGGGCAVGGRLPRIFRRRGRRLQWRSDRSRRSLRLHPARGARRLRRHRRLELPDPDRRLEIGAGARHGQCHGVQAVGKHAAFSAGAGRNLQRGRPARRALQRRAGLWRCRRGPRRPRCRRQGLGDRLGADRPQGAVARRLEDEARNDGTRRQVAADRLRRCRPRKRHRRRHARQFLFDRPDLLQRHACLRAERHPRPLRRTADRADEEDPHRRSARSRNADGTAGLEGAARQGRRLYRDRQAGGR